jgi:hypothetical protein
VRCAKRHCGGAEPVKPPPGEPVVAEGEQLTAAIHAVEVVVATTPNSSRGHFTSIE